MNADALQDKADLKEIFSAMDRGEIDYDQAKKEAAPIIARINQRGRAKTDELNRKYGMKRKYHNETFINSRRSKGLL